MTSYVTISVTTVESVGPEARSVRAQTGAAYLMTYWHDVTGMNRPWSAYRQFSTLTCPIRSTCPCRQTSYFPRSTTLFPIQRATPSRRRSATISTNPLSWSDSPRSKSRHTHVRIPKTTTRALSIDTRLILNRTNYSIRLARLSSTKVVLSRWSHSRWPCSVGDYNNSILSLNHRRLYLAAGQRPRTIPPSDTRSTDNAARLPVVIWFNLGVTGPNLARWGHFKSLKIEFQLRGEKFYPSGCRNVNKHAVRAKRTRRSTVRLDFNFAQIVVNRFERTARMVRMNRSRWIKGRMCVCMCVCVRARARWKGSRSQHPYVSGSDYSCLVCKSHLWACSDARARHCPVTEIRRRCCCLPTQHASSTLTKPWPGQHPRVCRIQISLFRCTFTILKHTQPDTDPIFDRVRSCDECDDRDGGDVMITEEVSVFWTWRTFVVSGHRIGHEAAGCGLGTDPSARTPR